MKFKSFVLLILISSYLFSASPNSNLDFGRDFSLSLERTPAGETSVTDMTFTADIHRDSAENKSVKSKRFWRAAGIMGMIWLADSIRYWASYSGWIEDWQYELTWKDQKKRFFSLEANRFDSNPFITNWTHGLGGAIYFNIARYHNLTILESLLFESVTSLTWEYVTEWREVVSINDNFFSGIGGLPIGEPFFQLGKYLLSRPGTLNRVFGYLINPVFAISDLFGGRRWRSHFRENYFSSPDAFISLSNEHIGFRDKGKQRKNRFSLNLGTRFMKIPGYGQPSEKTIKSSFSTTLFTSIDFGVSYYDQGVDEYRFETKVIYLGGFRQRIDETPTGGLKGYSLFYGMASAYRFYKKRALEEYDKGQYHYDFHEFGDNSVDDSDADDTNGPPDLPVNFTDKMAVINLAGPTVQLTLHAAPARLTLQGDAYLDFGLINAFAINKYSQSHDIFTDRMKTTLAYYGYYYAFGYTLDLRSQLQIRGFSAGAGFRYQSYGSIQGRDRLQDRVVNDAKACDTRSVLQGSLTYHFPRGPISLSIRAQRILRRGSIEDVTVKEREDRIYSSLNFHF